jgi:hypothetical protein
MSEFFEDFLTEDGMQLQGVADRGIALGAFGKHPGWDDHIEDLGLETESLITGKKMLYIHGVGGQIDKGSWEKLGSDQRLADFNHVFLWQRAGQFLLGKMWSSSDGKGRKRYPMVVCAHCIGASLGWALRTVLPRLDTVESACKATNSAAEVRALLQQARSGLRAMLTQPDASGEYAPVPPGLLNEFVSSPTLGPDRRGWFRIVHQLQNLFTTYGRGTFNLKNDLSGLRPQQVRLPTAGTSPPDALLLWTRFLFLCVDPPVPFLLAVSPGQQWLDATVGKPSTEEFFCLRATPRAFPLATEVPYELDEKVKGQTLALLTQLQSGTGTVPVSRPLRAEDSGGGGWFSVTQRWFRRGRKAG